MIEGDLLTTTASAVGAHYGMTATDVLAYLAVGDRRHPDAPAEECGAVDPRNESRWCRRPVGHDRDYHHPYREAEDWGEPYRPGAGMGPGGSYCHDVSRARRS